MNQRLPKIKTGYKVVFREIREGKACLLSAICYKRYYRSNAIIKYPIGEPAYPAEGCGPLAVFKSKKDAKRWQGYLSEPHTEIWECEYEPSYASYLRDGPLCNQNLSNYDEGKTKALHIRLLPWGSALAKWVKLIRKVEEE